MEKRVDAGRVGEQQVAGFCIQRGKVRLCRAANPERAQKPVGIERRRAEDFGQSSGTDPAVDFHLPETILRVHVPERVCGIGRVLGVNVGNAVAVAQHIYRCAQPCGDCLALKLR